MNPTNDEKIKALLETIENKRKSLGTCPKACYETNGIVDGNKNINAITDVQSIFDIACVITTAKGAYEQVAAEFQIDLATIPIYQRAVNELHDLKVRLQIIKWNDEKKKLQTLEKQLKSLMSTDAKTADQLSDIESLLK